MGIPEQTQTPWKTVQDQNRNGHTGVGAQRPGLRVTARQRTANIFIKDCGLVSNSPHSVMTPWTPDTQDKHAMLPSVRSNAFLHWVSRVIAPEDVAVLVPGACAIIPNKRDFAEVIKVKDLEGMHPGLSRRDPAGHTCP